MALVFFVSLLLFSHVVAKKQECVLRVREGPEQKGETCTFQQFEMCEFSCVCSGYEQSMPTQLDGTCNGANYSATFVWYSIGFDATEYDMSYDVQIPPSPVAFNATTANISVVLALDSADITPIAFMMKYNPIQTFKQSTSLAFIGKNDFTPCVHVFADWQAAGSRARSMRPWPKSTLSTAQGQGW